MVNTVKLTYLSYRLPPHLLKLTIRNLLMRFFLLLCSFISLSSISTTSHSQSELITQSPQTVAKTAVFAGGCFWCIEADFEKLKGVNSVVSGYTGGSAETATYKQVTYIETGHYEAVEVNYNPDIVSYSELVEYFWRHIDPTNDRGQFCDSGSSYLSAIFYANEEEQKIVAESLKNLNDNKPFKDPIVTDIKAATPFYLAEDYHQDYYKINPIRYNLYRRGCGRDRRIEQLWGATK